MKKLTLSLICLLCAVALSAADRFVSFTPADGATLMADRGTGMAREIVFDSRNEHKGVAIALGNLAEDFNRVCGVIPPVVDMKQARGGKGCMGVEPVTASSYPDGDGPALKYELEFKGDAPAKLALGILPTNDVNPARGLRVGVRVDDGETIIVDARQGYVDEFKEYTKDNIARSGVLKPLPPRASDIYLAGVGKRMRNEIFDNLRWLSIPLGQVAPGRHRLSVVMVDPEIVVEKLVLNPDNEHPSYYGSPAE